MRAPALLLTVLLLGAAMAAAEEVGTVVDLRPRVMAFPPGQGGQPLEKHDPVQRGLKVRLDGEKPYLRVALHFGKGEEIVRTTGVAVLRGASNVDFGDTARPSEPTIRILLGKLWLALLPGEDLDVESPDLVASIKGTYLRVLVDPAIGTFLAVDEGTVSVQAKAGGRPVLVTPGHWVLVPPGGLPTRPVPLPPGEDDEILEDPPLLGCCSGTEPPKPPQ